MSTYEYLEFVAVERALDEAARTEMRRVSSRGTITANRFVNEYHYGEFKGDAERWMERWFDAYVNSCSWEHCTLMLGVPLAVLPKRAMADFTGISPSGSSRFARRAFAARVHADRWLLRWSYEGESGENERFWTEEDGPGWMARLLPLRAELSRGDLRPLYLGWLARVCEGEIEEDDPDELEPPLPLGLRELSAAQESLAEFLLIDPDWLAAAAVPSEPLPDVDDSAELARFVAERSPEALRATARRLLGGRAVEAERELRREWLAWLAEAAPDVEPVSRRSVADIAAELDAVLAARLERERRADERAERAREKARAKHLATVLKRVDQRWAEIERSLERGSGNGYDEALRVALELSEALAGAGREAEFRGELERLLETHGRRRAWRQRLVRAGLIER